MDTHTIRLTVDGKLGCTGVTLDGVELPNVTGIRITGDKWHAKVELTMEYVSVEVGGTLRHIVSKTTTETYEAGSGRLVARDENGEDSQP